MPFIANLKLFLAGLALSVATFFNPSIQSPNLGAVSSFQPVQAAPTYLSGAGVTSVQTTVPVTAFVTRQLTLITTANIGGIGYATIDPGTSKEENVSFTGITQNTNGTAVLTGVTRGLQDVYPYTSTSSFQIAHSGGATLITSNSGAFYSQFNIAANTSTITGNWTFASTSLPQVTSDTPTSSFTTYNLIDKQYADSLSFAGAPNGNSTTKGIYQEATTSTIANGSTTGSTGADLVLSQRTASTTSQAYSVPETSSNGKIDISFITLGNNTVSTGTAPTVSAITLSGSSTPTYSGATSSFIVPSGVSTITITAQGGASGQASNGSGAATGTIGSGGRMIGTLSVSPATTYYYAAGGTGGNANNTSHGVGAFGGGGNGGDASTGAGGGGGGMTWFSSASTFAQGSTVLLVAAGGGAPGGATNTSNQGGAGGGASGTAGGNGTGSGTGGGGGTQVAGGTCSAGCTAGTAGVGGNGITGGSGAGGGGGGGGYYGGGGGGNTINSASQPGGGGGSSFTSSNFTSTSTAPGTNNSSGTLQIAYSQTLTPTIVGNNFTGLVTMPQFSGTAPLTTFTLNFATNTTSFANPPSCLLEPQYSTQWYVSSLSTSSVSFTLSSDGSNQKLNYLCVGY